MIRTARALVFSAGLLLCTLGCEQKLDVQTAAGEESLIAHYTTFGLLLPDPDELRQSGIKPETLQRLSRLSTDSLLDLGYRPTAAEQADLLIAIRPGVKSFRQLHAYAPLGRSDNLPAERGYDEGILTMSFIDARLKQSILERVAQIRLGDGVSEEQMQAVVARLFEGIPHATRESEPSATKPEPPAASAAPAAVP
jgi:hypothetical protein